MQELSAEEREKRIAATNANPWFWIKLFLLDHLWLFKILTVLASSIIAVFLSKDNSWNHWSWIVYAFLIFLYIFLEIIEKKQSSLSPLEKFKIYLLDFENWSHGEKDYYIFAPEYTIRNNYDEDNFDYKQEWTRGEIGAHYSHGNVAYYVDLYYYETLLEQVPVVVFDGGKKTVVAPFWEAVGSGRFYYYLEKSTEYAYQKYLSAFYNKDNSKNIKARRYDKFDIPVFKDQKILDEFIDFCNLPISDPERDEEQQNLIFYGLLKKYEEFQDKS